MDEKAFKKVQELISRGKTDEAFVFLKSVESILETKKEIAIISNRFFELQKKSRLNFISENEIIVESNKINFDLLNSCEASLDKFSQKRKTKKGGNALKSTFLVLFFLVFIFLYFDLNNLSFSSLISTGDRDSINTTLILPKNQDFIQEEKNKLPEVGVIFSKKDTSYHDQVKSSLKYDNDKYVYVDGVLWMKQNLSSTGDNQSLCFKNKKKYCEKFGSLFTWNQANNACNKLGWRLPVNHEWENLINHFGCGYFDIPLNKRIGQNNRLNFNRILIGGNSSIDIEFGGKQLIQNGDFEGLGKVGYYWSESNPDFSGAKTYFIFEKYTKEIKRNEGESIAISCRCVISLENFKNLKQ